MSEPSSPDAKPREHLGGVLGVGFGLLLILSLVAGLLTDRTSVLDPAETFGTWFEPAELPYGWTPLDAARDAQGTRMLRLAGPETETEPEAERIQPAKGASRGGAHEPFDWHAIPIGSVGTPPREAMLVSWPFAVAKGKLDGLFGTGGAGFAGGGGPGRSLRANVSFTDPLAGLSSKGGRRVLERGKLPWGRFEAPFAHERHFEQGGTFVDTLRVNLSTEREGLVLFLRWPRGLPAGKERAQEVLDGLARRSPDSDADAGSESL